MLKLIDRVGEVSEYAVAAGMAALFVVISLQAMGVVS